MRAASAIAISLLALALGSCGGDSGSKRSALDVTAGPTGATGPPKRAQAGGRDAAAPRPAPGVREAGFDNSTVKVSFLERSRPFGARSQVTYFIAQGPASSWLDQAKRCVREYLAKAPSAYCFAFASPRAFRFARVSRRPPARMRRPCWSVYWGKPKGRREIGAAENPAAAGQECPDAYP